MEDKPTLKEYLGCRDMRYVRTIDGRYFVITTPWYWLIPVTLGVYFIILSVILWVADAPWNVSITDDLVVIISIIVFLLPRRIYRIEKFELLQEGSEEYIKASARTYYRGMRIALLVVTIFICVVFSLSGFTLSYFRSLTDTPKAEGLIGWATREGQRFETDQGDIALPAEKNESVNISINTFHTPYVPQLMLDGKTIEIDKYSSGMTLLFSEYYFSQDIDATIFATNIHDGSILTLTCGKWSYEWMFVSEAP